MYYDIINILKVCMTAVVYNSSSDIGTRMAVLRFTTNRGCLYLLTVFVRVLFDYSRSSCRCNLCENSTNGVELSGGTQQWCGP